MASVIVTTGFGLSDLTWGVGLFALFSLTVFVALRLQLHWLRKLHRRMGKDLGQPYYDMIREQSDFPSIDAIVRTQKYYCDQKFGKLSLRLWK